MALDTHVVTAAASAAGPAAGARYRPHLDGLRAVAVYLVVAFHSGLPAFSGGFVGVDVFFVLSGYLVTQLLLRDLGGRGHIRLRRFYARRYRRLLPAAFVALAVTAVAWVLVATAAEVSDSVAAFRASFLYYANWYFIHQSADYFAADVNHSPVIHFWSLAVEEQFYLAWPLLFGSVYALCRRFGAQRVRVVRAVVFVAAVASALAALHLAHNDLTRAYYGTDTRAYQLLAGALLALTPRLFRFPPRAERWLEAVGIAALAGIVVLATSSVDWETIHRGVAVTLVSATLIVAVENARRGPVTNALSHRASTYLGRVSYGTYLWHWPVIVVLTRETSLGSFPVFVLACAIATSFAAASYHVIELPVRRSPRLDRYALPVIACGLALSALGGLVVVPAILGTKHSSTLVARGSGQVDPTALDWRAAKDDIPPLPECTLDHPSSCTIVRGTGPHILLMGDSNARMWIPTFSRIAQREHLSLSVAAAPLCPWQRGLYYLLGIDTCKARQADWYGGLLDELDPDIVVVADRPIDDPANAVAVGNVFGAQQPGASGFEPLLQRTSAKSIDALRADGRKVVILEPIPISTEAENPLNCLSSASTVDQCVYEANTARTPLEQYYASAAVPGAVWSFDLDRVVCPRLPKCDPMVNGIITKRDSDHITATYAAAIADQVDARLKAAGLLPRN